MLHTIEFHANQLTGSRFAALLGQLAEEVARTEDRDTTVTARRAAHQYAAHAVAGRFPRSATRPAGPVPARPTTKNELVGALHRYYVATARRQQVPQPPRWTPPSSPPAGMGPDTAARLRESGPCTPDWR
jgi:hypothetical protein